MSTVQSLLKPMIIILNRERIILEWKLCWYPKFYKRNRVIYGPIIFGYFFILLLGCSNNNSKRRSISIIRVGLSVRLLVNLDMLGFSYRFQTLPGDTLLMLLVVCSSFWFLSFALMYVVILVLERERERGQ